MSKANDDCTAQDILPAISEPIAAVVAQGRPAVEAAIETLIEALDVQEADPDLEPSLANSESDLEHDEAEEVTRAPYYRAGDSEDDEPNGDEEPSLGASEPGRYIGQQDWTAGCGSDLEPSLTTVTAGTGEPKAGHGRYPIDAECPGYNSTADIEARRKMLGIKPRTLLADGVVPIAHFAGRR